LASSNESEATRVLRTLVEFTTERAIATAESLSRDFRAQTDAAAIPEMTEFWDRVDSEADLIALT
jgi:hypothetical protein